VNEMMTVTEAQEITDEIRGAVEAMDRWAGVPAALLRAREGRAWEAMGYESWRQWAMEACGLSQSRVYQLANYGKALRELDRGDENSTTGGKAAKPPTERKVRTERTTTNQSAPTPKDDTVYDVESRPAADPATGEVADPIEWLGEREYTVGPAQQSFWPDDLRTKIAVRADADGEDPVVWVRRILEEALAPRRGIGTLRSVAPRALPAAPRVPARASEPVDDDRHWSCCGGFKPQHQKFCATKGKK
jgi:hypothetical protein